MSLTPFDSLQAELEMYVSDIGLTPMQAIQAATANAARALGVDGLVGTLITGQAADMIAVGGDPSVRIEDLRSVRVVIKGGRTVVENGVVLD